MQQLAIMCVLCSAAIVCLLGVAHWVLTFYSDKFQPRDQSLLLHLQRESPQLTRQTSMWRAWIGFNASHSLGAIFFGLNLGYFALVEPAILMNSYFLQGLSLTFLLGYVLLARRYWFNIPLRGCIAASLLFIAAILLWHN